MLTSEARELRLVFAEQAQRLGRAALGRPLPCWGFGPAIRRPTLARPADWLLVPWSLEGNNPALPVRVRKELELAYRAGLRPDGLVVAWRSWGCPEPGVPEAVLGGPRPGCLLGRLGRLLGLGRPAALLAYFEADPDREMGLYIELGRWRE